MKWFEVAAKMMRIKKKFILLIFVAIFFILVFYLLQSNVPSNKSNIFYIEEKLKQLENGLNKHKKKFGEIQEKIDTIQSNGMSNSIADPPRLKDDLLLRDEVMLEQEASHEESCNLNMDVVPKRDVQMLKAYREIPFDNPDGGVWKQGWNIEYDDRQWNRHHKLKVFVVPHR